MVHSRVSEPTDHHRTYTVSPPIAAPRQLLTDRGSVISAILFGTNAIGENQARANSASVFLAKKLGYCLKITSKNQRLIAVIGDAIERRFDNSGKCFPTGKNNANRQM